MQYVCIKQLTAGKKTYYPGDIIPDHVILPERSRKLIRNGYLSECNNDAIQIPIAEAIHPLAAEDSISMFPIKIHGEGSKEIELFLSLDELQRVFSILQMSAEEGVKQIAKVKSENALVLLHASDNRRTIKNAAKEQAEKVFSTKGEPNESTGGNETIDTNAEGADT